ncbi:MAG TPA: RNA methyltransferase [Bacteroidota bacterium]|nr:RNA methyltransferase [Bacteroidota bacterium]
MLSIISITSLDLPALQPYRTLRQPVEHFRAGIFVAEGEKVVRRLIESDLEILSALLTPEWLEEYRSLFESHSQQCTVYVADKNILETIVGYNLHQGIMAMGKIPSPATLEDVVVRSSEPQLFVALDGLTNSENIGVAVRNCAAFGVQAVIVGETSSSPYLRRAVRNSMGTVFKIPIVHSNNLLQALEALRTQHRVKILAAHPHTEEHVLPQTDCRTNLCLVLGSEGEGISQQILAACDEAVAVPMHNGVDSLNVSSASAVFLYEVFRQRSLKH